MLKICGVELSGNEAIISLLTEHDEMFTLPDCRVRRVTCNKPDTANDLKYFQKTFKQLMDDYQIDVVVIRERMKKGKFSGGADGFKLEAAIQLIDGLKVVLMNPTDQKQHLKHYPLPIPFSETGLKKFQEASFMTAFAYYASKHEW